MSNANFAQAEGVALIRSAPPGSRISQRPVTVDGFGFVGQAGDEARVQTPPGEEVTSGNVTSNLGNKILYALGGFLAFRALKPYLPR